MPILSLIIFFPLICAVALIFFNKENKQAIRWFAFITSLLNFVVSLYLYIKFNSTTSAYQFEENFLWIKEFNINYHLGIDGISLLLVLLTTFLTPVCILSCFTSIEKRVKEFMIAMLVLESAMTGVFCSLDLILFYVFWEVMLVPMFLMIGVWGGERRIYAAIKFFLYTMFGSVFMLVAIIILYYLNHQTTFDLTQISTESLTLRQQVFLFFGFFIAFAIKVPMFPFHTWLPDAHVEAPTPGSVILAGVLLKMGTYGLMRFCLPMFPQAVLVLYPYICTVAIIGIIYGGLVSVIQPDLKKLVAYSSVSHLGFVVLGLFVLNIQGAQGALLQMINHGLSTGGLFLAVGIIYERRHTRLISEFGGLTKVMPVFSVLFLIITLSSLGLPGLNNFVGEFLILVGSFQTNMWFTVFAASGVILAAVYLLWAFQRVMHGEIKNEKNKNLADVNTRELITLMSVIVFIFLLGIYPKPFLQKISASCNKIVKIYEPYNLKQKNSLFKYSLTNREIKNVEGEREEDNNRE